MTGLIILAAGESSRLGQPKQNLLLNGKTLLQHAVEGGLKSECEKVIVVLGANSDQITPIAGTTTLYNKEWKYGMASSIRIGMSEVNNIPSVKNVIIMLCDQPFVTETLLNSLIARQKETDKPIVACTYKDTIGVPVIFDSIFFAELLTLQGEEGAKKILKNHPEEIATIQFENGDIDIDTPEDYEKLCRLSN